MLFLLTFALTAPPFVCSVRMEIRRLRNPALQRSRQGKRPLRQLQPLRLRPTGQAGGEVFASDFWVKFWALRFRTLSDKSMRPEQGAEPSDPPPPPPPAPAEAGTCKHL